MKEGTLSHEAFASIAEISADAIISVDTAQRILFFNRGAEQIFGYQAGEVIGEELDILIPHRFRDVHRRHVEDFGESGVAARRMGERRSISGLRSSGEEFPAEASISRIDSGGERIYTVVLRDITAQRKAQSAQELLARAGALLTSSLDYQRTLLSVAALATSELAEWCVVYMIEPGDVVRRVGFAHSDPDRAALLERLSEAPLLAGSLHPARRAIDEARTELVQDISDAQLDALAIDDGQRDILHRLELRSALVAPLTARGRTLGAIGLYSTDPRRFGSEEARLAEELARRAALAVDNALLYRTAQEAVAARDEVLSVVSHDLGNPLSAIRVGTRVLERKLAEDPASAPEWIGNIRDSADQIERLISDLLEVQRIEAGRLALDLEVHRPGPIVEEAVERFASIAAERRIELSGELHGRLPQVRVDPHRIHQVLSNLLGNALKFTPEGGRVSVTAEPRDPGVVVSVTDTGPGIPPDELDLIFDRFWQARRSATQGAGLGLTIARGIVEAHGGEIWAESEIGVGTTLLFALPASSPPEAEPGV